MPSPLGMTLMSMGQPSASCGHYQARCLAGSGLLRAPAPSAGASGAANTLSLPPPPHPPVLRQQEPSTTRPGGHSAPWEPGDQALGHLRSLASQPRSLKCVGRRERLS